MVDLPLIDEDTCVFRNEEAIQRCVSGGAEKQRLRQQFSMVSIYIYSMYTLVVITLFISLSLCSFVMLSG